MLLVIENIYVTENTFSNYVDLLFLSSGTMLESYGSKKMYEMEILMDLNLSSIH